MKKLVFVWRNVSIVGEQPGAIIDNIQIATGLCDSVTDLTVSNITATSAEISWNGSATGYEIRLNGGDAEPVTGTSKTLTDLSEGAEYTVEVRAVCGYNCSEWVSTEFTTLQSGLAEEIGGTISAKICPNPAKDKAILKMSGLTEDASLIVSDIQGKIVISNNIARGSENHEINLKGLASGIYTVTIASSKTKTTQKLIVE